MNDEIEDAKISNKVESPDEMKDEAELLLISSPGSVVSQASDLTSVEYGNKTLIILLKQALKENIRFKTMRLKLDLITAIRDTPDGDPYKAQLLDMLSKLK